MDEVRMLAAYHAFATDYEAAHVLRIPYRRFWPMRGSRRQIVCQDILRHGFIHVVDGKAHIRNLEEQL